jgi:hypothetical protein
MSIIRRAFLIAIEDYANNGPFAAHLTGTNASAQAFYDWLTNVRQVPPGRIHACVGTGLKWGTAGTTRAAIVGELVKLRDIVVAESTDELHFFFSGHGFSNPNSVDQLEDVLVASDFVSMNDDGDKCINLAELQLKLLRCLGPGHHFYFVDACRNPINQKIRVSPIVQNFPVSDLGEADRHAIHSTAQGLAAAAATSFSATVLNGLNGAGRKIWKGNKLQVTFGTLADYVGLRFPESRPDRGKGDPVILEIKPVPPAECEVMVDNAVEGDKFTFTATSSGLESAPVQFGKGVFKPKLPPNDYIFLVTHPQAAVVKRLPPTEQLYLWEKCEVHFEKVHSDVEAVTDGEPRTPGVEAALKATAAPGVLIELKDLARGKTSLHTGLIDRELRPGRYEIQLMEAGIPISRHRITLQPGETSTISLLPQEKSPVQESILAQVPRIRESGLPDFSETLQGATAISDTGYLLALLGSSRILREKGEFHKLAHLKMASFAQAKPGEAPIYIVCGFGVGEQVVKIAVRGAGKPRRYKTAAVAALAGVGELLIPNMPGGYLVSIQRKGRDTMTLSTYSLPNRATLITLHDGPDNRLRIHQYLLPIHSLFRHLDPTVLRYLQDHRLGVVRSTFLAQQFFAKRDSISLKMKSEWDDLIFQKWLDPLMCLIVAFDLVRSGEYRKNRHLFDVMMRNLRKYFGGLPDTEALAKMAKQPFVVPSAPPLLLDAYLALQQGDEEAADGAFVDYKSPWTLWNGMPRSVASRLAVAPKPAANRPLSPAKNRRKTAPLVITPAPRYPLPGKKVAARAKKETQLRPVPVKPLKRVAAKTARRRAPKGAAVGSGIVRRKARRDGISRRTSTPGKPLLA